MHGSKELNLHHHLVLFCLDDLLQIIDSCTKLKKKKIKPNFFFCLKHRGPLPFSAEGEKIKINKITPSADLNSNL